MDSAALLTPTDVNVIRRYVHTKYAPLPGARKAEIVADAVRSALERRLPELPPEVKASVTAELIRRCLVGERREVALSDVLQLLASGDWRERIDPEPLARWVEERTQGRWNRRQGEPRAARFRREVGPNAGAGDPAASASTATSTALASASIALAMPVREPALVPPDDAPADVRLAEVIPLSAAAPAGPLAGWRRHAAWLALLLALGAGAALGLLDGERSPDAALDPGAAVRTAPPAPARQPEAGMPASLRYAAFDEGAVKTYLRSRDSLLADEPYFGAIIDAAREYDVHPLLLLAITGQEQGFVPRTGKQAKRIANNPFNVFHSWQEYNTDIADSAAVAAKLIAKQGASRPAGEEPFAWLNRVYAEDAGWADGVRRLFDKLTHLPADKP